MKKLVKKYKYTLLLISVAAFWGTSYSLSKICQDYVSAYTLLAFRFLGAFALTFPFLRKSLMPLRAQEIKRAAQLGAIMFMSCLTMVLGVKSTTATNAGFLVGMSVVFIPVIQRIVYKVQISLHMVFALLLSFSGISFLTLGGELGTHSGDSLCPARAIFYASYVVLTGNALHGLNPVAVGVMQFLFMGLYAMTADWLTAGFSFPTALQFWASILVMIVFGTAFCFIIQVIAQQHVSAAAAGVILSLEPVFAAFFSFLILGERLGLGQFIGAALMLSGVVWISVREK